MSEFSFEHMRTGYILTPHSLKHKLIYNKVISV